MDFEITNVSVSVNYYLEEMMSLSGTQQRAWDFPTVGSIGIAHCTMTEEPVLANEVLFVREYVYRAVGTVNHKYCI